MAAWRFSKLEADVSVRAGQSKRCLVLNELGEISLRSEFLHASFAGRDASCLLIGERYLHLPEAHLRVRLIGNTIELTATAFARQVALQAINADAVDFEDNCFDLLPGQTRAVRLQPGDWRGRIRVSAVNGQPIEIGVNQKD